MACPTCGYSEADLVHTPGYDGSTLPEAIAALHKHLIPLPRVQEV